MKQQEQAKLLTAEDLYTLPDDERQYELIAGRLLSEPPPGSEHGLIIARIVLVATRV